MKNGKYQINEHGIVYVPISKIDSLDFEVKVFESGNDISSVMRYAGTVNRKKSIAGVNSNYKFVQFYLPKTELRSIPNANKYWHEKGYEYREQAGKIFDSLLLNEKLFFR